MQTLDRLKQRNIIIRKCCVFRAFGVAALGRWRRRLSGRHVRFARTGWRACAWILQWFIARPSSVRDCRRRRGSPPSPSSPPSPLSPPPALRVFVAAAFLRVRLKSVTTSPAGNAYRYILLPSISFFSALPRDDIFLV